MRSSFVSFYVQADSKKMEQNLVALAEKRDADLARIRGVRDEIAAQNRELKAREELKFRSADEMQKLADTRAVRTYFTAIHACFIEHTQLQARIEVLQSELARVKSLLAAKAGDESLAGFLAAEKSGDITYVESLKERLSYVCYQRFSLLRAHDELGKLRARLPQCVPLWSLWISSVQISRLTFVQKQKRVNSSRRPSTPPLMPTMIGTLGMDAAKNTREGRGTGLSAKDLAFFEGL